MFVKRILFQQDMYEKNHIMVKSALIHEFKTNKLDYLSKFGSEEHFEYIMNGLHTPTNSGGIAYIGKWLILTNMGHIVANC